MQLTAFRIFKYRNIEDSGLINLFDRLTCIVGKNQSGKTNLLRALQKFNPHDKSVKYDWRADWPRGGRRTREERQVVCEAHFDLDVEHSELVSLTDANMTAKKVIVTKNYASEYTVEFPNQPELFAKRVHPAEIDQVCAKFAVPSTEVGEAFFRATDECIAEAKQAAQQGRFAELAALAAPHRE